MTPPCVSSRTSASPASRTPSPNSIGPRASARVVISPERYDLLEADVILGTTSDPDQTALDDLQESELFSRVPAVARGSFLAFGIGPATAMAFPSVLGVRFALAELVDDLADAVAASETASPSEPEDESSSEPEEEPIG